MSPDRHILRDLLAGQSTADSLAPRCKMSTEKAIAHLVTLKREGKVTSEPIAELKNLHAYRITLAGKDLSLIHISEPTRPIG